MAAPHRIRSVRWFKAITPNKLEFKPSSAARTGEFAIAIFIFSATMGMLWLNTVPLTGSYEFAWRVAVALGVGAGLPHWPIDERPITSYARVV